MAGPIKIAVIADAQAATKSVKDFSADVESSVNGAAGGLERAARRSKEAGKDIGDGIERGVEGADRAEQRVMGFRDTLTGAQDTMKGTALLAKGDLFNGFLTLGMGLGDLASGFANLLIPALGKAAGAMKALNLTMLTNPVFLVIVAIVALVAIFVVAYKKSETFRRIVDGAFRGVLNVVRSVWNWVKGNWPLLLAIITGPIGLAVRFVVRHFDTIKAKIQSIPRAIKGAFTGAGHWLTDAGRNIISGLWNGIQSLYGWLIGKVQGFINATVPGPIRRALGINSPSKVAKQIGSFFGQGLGIGLDGETSRVGSAAGRLASAAVRPLASGTGGSGASSQTTGVTLVLQASGDPLMDAIFEEFRKRVRVQGGNVQVVLGR